MILGVGTDIIDVNRIHQIYNKFNYKFVERLYGTNEINILNLVLINKLINYTP